MTENRLIYANVLEKDIFETADMYKTDHLFIDVITYAIENASTVDAVEVVRCKDCRHHEHHDTLLYCGHTRGMAGSVSPDSCCSYGERRTDA